MAIEKQISDLPPTATLFGSFQFAIDDATAVTYKVTMTQITAFITAALGSMAVQNANTVSISGGSAVLSALTAPWTYANIAAPANILATNSGAFFEFTAATTLADALGLAAYANGFAFALKNTSGGDASFVPKTGDLIDGNASLTIAPQQGYIVMKSGAQWSTVAINGQGLLSAAEIQDQAFTYAADSGAANAYVIAPAPAYAAYADGQVISFTPAQANTTASTIKVNALAVVPLVLQGNVALVGGEVLANGSYTAIYNASYSAFVLNGSASAATPKQIQVQAYTSAVDTGGANAYAVALSPAVAAYADKLLVVFSPVNANTGASTINVNGVGAAPIVLQGGAALAGGEMLGGSTADYILIYNSTLSAFVLANSSAGNSWINQNSNSVTMARNTTYTTNNAGVLVTYQLPLVYNGGDYFRILGYSAGGWAIAQQGGQQTLIGNVSTTAGAGGSISSNDPTDNILIRALLDAPGGLFTVETVYSSEINYV